MIIYLVRHGETIWNRDNLFQGQSDVELTDLGKSQSEKVANRLIELGVGSVHTSPLTRTRYIADRISEGIRTTPIENKGLLELNLGLLEGKTGKDLRREWPEIIEDWRKHPSRVAMPSGESFKELHMRSTLALKEIIKIQAENPVAIITHNFVIKVLICEILGLTVDSLHKIHIGLASISQLYIDESNSSLGSLNCNEHLN